MTNDIETTSSTSTTPVGLLAGKVVFITGASRGIGAAAARLFAREGAAVVLAARSTGALDRVVTEVRACGGTADAVTMDLADPASIRAAVDRVGELHGRLDGAFNNGAAGQPPGPLDTTSDQVIDDQFAVNCAHRTATTAEGRAHAPGRRRGDRHRLEHRQPLLEPRPPRLRRNEARAQQHHRDRRDLARQGIRVNGITPAAPRRK